MKINCVLFLIISLLVLGGCVKQNTNQASDNTIIADEKFCIAKTQSNISSDEAYEIAKQSACAQAGIVTEDCNCDNNTYTCSFTIETDKTDCHPVCVVDLKTQKTEIDWNCNDGSKASP
ncbi:MAG: hypothetical protein Q7K65_02780 [Candidatus Buchananbacteria bacterium]|nr:hypothetical protein [Candidatus Buchananbacteria bacterium]